MLGQFIFLTILVALRILKRFTWNKFFLLTILFFVSALLLPEKMMGMRSCEDSKIKAFLWSSYTFIIFYPLPAFCVLRLRKMINAKINIILDLGMQCLVFYILWFLFYITLLFTPVALLSRH
jgi:hypothetical protein